ncbi:hypothetical protein TSTA_096020 [Talaromyces stipitatus ATCC 10500]|uniref:Uncharacterized protein n=1 Tax=Talaromyces stipitatus (strain ATCC 10500 / CBS 375.48 / QM 6759 / NRRL 1006) TaxID=441959 RepID=B8M3I1_TALSN|nr:uncharacterized protein TSTA_096020 [Talaromyces stipitatus ATCC 10500]EED22353.1 hypothetical protein TSTA_096020 [Talaromyces stipitatus ATCC 10500]
MSRLTRKDIKQLEDIEQLAKCFYANVKSPHSDCPELRDRIENLSRHLRASTGNIFHKKGGFQCNAHKGLSAEHTSKIFESLRTDLAEAVNTVKSFEFLFGPDENTTLKRVANTQKNVSRWRDEANQCEACVLSRVATNPSLLRELRTLFLAALPIAPDRPIGRLPPIWGYIDQWIGLSGDKNVLHSISDQRAKIMRHAMYEWKLYETKRSAKGAARPNKHDHFHKSFFGRGHTKPAPQPSTPSTPVTQRARNPLISPTLSQTLSRNAYELSETDFLREFSPSKGFYRAPPGNNYPYSFIDMYSQNPERTPSIPPKQQHQSRPANPATTVSPRLSSTWPSMSDLQSSQSQYSCTRAVSRRTPPPPPKPQPIPRTPERNKVLPPIPNVSPLSIPQDKSPPQNRARPSTSSSRSGVFGGWSSGEDVVGKKVKVKTADKKTRVVDVRATAVKGKHRPK